MAREMKDSGINEIGLVPDNWLRHVKVGFYFYFKSGDTLTSLEIENIGQYTVYGANGLRGFYSKYNTIGCHILLGRVGALCGNVHLIGGKNWVTEHSLICSPKKECNQNYFAYLFEIMNLGQFSKASAQPVISVDTISHLFFVVPPINEQRNIVGFLNYKCSQIDSLIADITKEIELLKEYRKSVIYEAVTKGLDPNVEMKDSGIEWVGKIPAHWLVHRLSNYFIERKHLNIFCKEENLLSLSYGRIIRKDINSNGGLLPESFRTYNIIEPFDIIIRPTDLQNDKKSLRTGLVTEHGIITSAYIALIPKHSVDSRYFHYLLHTYDIEKVFYNMGNGVRQGLNYNEFARLLVVTPPYSERNKIVLFLDSKCSEIDSLISDKQQQIDKLTEYKKSLIYEYVTGKKEVPAV